MKDLRTRTQRVAETIESERHDHEFLHVDAVVGVLAAVDDVHHRCRQAVCSHASQIPKQGEVTGPGRRVGTGQRTGQNRVGSEIRLVFGAVGVEHHPVDRDLIGDVQVEQRVGDVFVDIGDRLGDPFAEVDRSCRRHAVRGPHAPRARTAGNGRTADGAVFQFHVDFDRRIAAAVQNLAGVTATIDILIVRQSLIQKSIQIRACLFLNPR